MFPSDVATGIEFSWQFVEADASNGDDARRVLSCAGAEVETIAAEILDLGDPGRRGVFRFDCDDGFQTASELARTASEAFVELYPREYETTLRVDDVGESLGSRTVKVLGRAATLELWEFTRAPVQWSLTLQGEACAEVTLALYYADPAAALAEPPMDEDGDATDVLYRSALVSDRGLGVGGVPAACAGVAGAHVFAGIDRGSYRLEVTVDGASCALQLDLDEGVATTLDLDALPCGSG